MKPVRIPGLRGLCGICQGSILIRADGKLRYHGPHPKPCIGSGQQPIRLTGTAKPARSNSSADSAPGNSVPGAPEASEARS